MEAVVNGLMYWGGEGREAKMVQRLFLHVIGSIPRNSPFPFGRPHRKRPILSRITAHLLLRPFLAYLQATAIC